MALARSRGVWVVRGDGGRLPFRDGTFGAVLIVVTLCFASDPAGLLAHQGQIPVISIWWLTSR